MPFLLNNKHEKNDIQSNKMNKSGDMDISESDIEMFSDSTSFFNHRISKAFPGIRGIEWINNSKDAIDRLEILLNEPLNKKSLTDPIWFFRGSSCSDIESFKRISDNKCIIGYDECLVNRIAVYRSQSYKRSFVYVELNPETPIGVYEENKESIKFLIENFGYANEEYAIYNGHPITRQEFDDGAAIIEGKVVQFNEGAQIRIRYLTKYNFVICAKFNPINSDMGDDISEKYLNYMLKDVYKFSEFVSEVEKLPMVREPYK